VKRDYRKVRNLYYCCCLQDKWRNISVTALWGSRKKAKLALKRTPLSGSRQDDNATAITIVSLANGDVGGQQIDAPSPPAGSCEPPRPSTRFGLSSCICMNS